VSRFYWFYSKLAFFLCVLLCIAIALSSLLHAEEKNTIRLGVMDGDEADVWRVASDVAEREGFHIKLVIFSDYSIPNEALSAGDIDANAIQHNFVSYGRLFAQNQESFFIACWGDSWDS
jgi:D-methionine transport system substrate-binding protein